MTEAAMKVVYWSVLAITSCALLLNAQPVAPWEMPSLMVRRSSESPPVETSIRDEALADDLRALRGALLEHGRGERGLTKEILGAEISKSNARRALSKAVKTHGEKIVAQARMQAASDFDDAFAQIDHPTDEAALVLGGFDKVLQDYDVMRGQTLVAPYATARGMYKARWNAIFGRPLPEGLSDDEAVAYWGWLALHADAAPMKLRLSALREFRRLGGASVPEAAAMFAIQSGNHKLCADILEREHRKLGNIRLLNLALGARATADNTGVLNRVDTTPSIP